MIVALSSTLVGVQNQREPNMWKLADTATVRLSPRSFHQLPHKIIRNLQERGCTIPQEFGNSDPHNVISGEFRTKGQRDWAVLCSRKRSSSILVFWGGSVHRFSCFGAALCAKSPQSQRHRTLNSCRLLVGPETSASRDLLVLWGEAIFLSTTMSMVVPNHHG